MNKKIIRKLAEESYTNNILDEHTVNKIATLLSRSDLKKYTKALKNIENKKTVIVYTPLEPQKKIQERIQQVYENKNIKYVQDPTLFVGVKIVDNDLITEINLKNTLQNLLSHLSKLYDNQ